ncbi:MAG: hypothetical protein HY291_23050 [Planctomycetes bacterium]|nr:hypothetical protein [Planctomycetota bacterium]
MNSTSHTGIPWAAVLACVLMLTAGAASAREEDDPAVFNTFFVPVSGEAYMLTIRRDRTFELKDPMGATSTGTVVTGPRDLALLAMECNRYFSYRVESNRDLTVQPAAKDAPDFTSPLGRMPPSGFGSQARLIAMQNYAPGQPTPPIASNGWRPYADLWTGRKARILANVNEE